MNKKSTVIIAVLILIAVTLTGAAVGIHRYNQAKLQTENKQTEEKAADNKKDAQENKTSETKDEDNTKKSEEESSQNAANTEKKPAFIYFVSNDDSNYDAAIKVFEELKKEYDGKVDFDLKNVTENPELLDNFQIVKGNTPALIMDGKEGITGLQMKMTDKATLKSEIEKALK